MVISSICSSVIYFLSEYIFFNNRISFKTIKVLIQFYNWNIRRYFQFDYLCRRNSKNKSKLFRIRIREQKSALRKMNNALSWHLKLLSYPTISKMSFSFLAITEIFRTLRIIFWKCHQVSWNMTCMHLTMVNDT